MGIIDRIKEDFYQRICSEVSISVYTLVEHSNALCLKVFLNNARHNKPAFTSTNKYTSAISTSWCWRRSTWTRCVPVRFSRLCSRLTTSNTRSFQFLARLTCRRLIVTTLTRCVSLVVESNRKTRTLPCVHVYKRLAKHSKSENYVHCIYFAVYGNLLTVCSKYNIIYVHVLQYMYTDILYVLTHTCIL